MKPGVGKTLASISVVDLLHKENLVDNVIIICPVSKVDDWARDMKEETPEIKNVFVTSYESSWRDKNSKIINDYLKGGRSIIILDEGQKIKSYDSKQSKFIQTISDKYKPYVLILSATPQNKKYIDLYPQYKTLDSKVFNLSAKEFKKNYCVEQLNYNLVYSGKSRFPFNEIVGYRQIDKMDSEIAKYSYYKKYESEYDRPIEIIQTFKMSSDMKYFKEKRVWPKMDEKELAEKLEKGDIDDLCVDYVMANRPTLYHIYMRECASGFVKDYYFSKNPKAQWLADFLDGNDGRLVVFTNFINETKVVGDVCEKAKRHYCIYDGSNKDLTNWDKYDDCIAIVNIQSGGAGLNVFVKTNIAIYFSLPENYIDFNQSKGRIDRIGQTKQPVYYYLIVEGGVERAIYKSLSEGKDFDLRMFEIWEKGEESKCHKKKK